MVLQALSSKQVPSPHVSTTLRTRFNLPITKNAATDPDLRTVAALFLDPRSRALANIGNGALFLSPQVVNRARPKLDRARCGSPGRNFTGMTEEQSGSFVSRYEDTPPPVTVQSLNRLILQ